MITEKLFLLRDEKYAEFQSRLTPGIPPELFIGVRVPELRALAKELIKTAPDEVSRFLAALPHKFYDENMLHGLLISEVKDFGECVRLLDEFLPFVDNWAVCDITSPGCFKKHRAELLSHIRRWCASDEVYTARFGMEMLMSHYLDKDFLPEYLDIPAGVISEEYYVNMMIAWFFATALTKQWDAALPYIKEKRLSPWVHNKSIQKATESRRISDERKEYLRSLKV